MKKLIMIPVFILLLCAFTFQNISDDQTTWERYFLLGQVGEDWAMTSCIAKDGNYLIAGYTKDLPNKSFVIKMTPTGDTIWSKKFEPNVVPTIVALTICPTDDNGAIFGGINNKLNLVKLNENGDIIWNNNYTEDHHSISAIKQMKDGTFVVTGIKYPFVARIFKIDDNGNIIWDHLHPELSGFGPFAETSDNGVIVLTRVQSTEVVKFSKDGIIEWQRPAPNGAFPSVINYIGDRKFLLSGYKDFVINEGGDILFQFEIPIYSSEILTGFLYSSTHDSITRMVRGTYSWLQFTVESRIVVYDFFGNILNEKMIIDSNNHSREIRGITQLEDGYLFTGIRNYHTGSESFGNSIGKSMIIKTDSLLNYKTVGITNNGITTVDNFSLEIYPNPFNASTKIKFTLPVREFVSISVYDVSGREIRNFEKKDYIAGVHEIIFDGSRLASGVYFYRLEVKGKNGQDFVSTRRMVLVK